jgi:hypothetical protein
METVSLNSSSMKIHGLYVYYLKFIGIKLILAFASNCNRRSTFLKTLNLVNTSDLANLVPAMFLYIVKSHYMATKIVNNRVSVYSSSYETQIEKTE